MMTKSNHGRWVWLEGRLRAGSPQKALMAHREIVFKLHLFATNQIGNFHSKI